MSALGQKRTFEHVRVMSALPPKADIRTQSRNVRFVQETDKQPCAFAPQTMQGGPSMGAKRVINGVHVVPMGIANAFLIEGQDGLTLIDAGFPGKEAAVFQAIRGLGRSPEELKHLVFTHGHPDHIGSAVRSCGNQCEDLHAPARYIHGGEWRSVSTYEAGTWSIGASAMQAVLRSRRANGAGHHRPAFGDGETLPI